nr:ionotropic receptor 75a-like [Vanessa tameamea]
MKKVIFVSLILFLRCTFCFKAGVNIRLLMNMIENLEKPSSILAITCWPLFAKIQLFEGNGDHKYMIQFINPGDVHLQFAHKQHILFLADLNCPDVVNSLKKYEEAKMFRSPFRWILIDRLQNASEDLSILQESITQIDILIDTEVFVIREIENKIESGVLRPNVIDVALFTFGAACQQGSTVELKGALGRMVLLLLFVALTFLYTSYSANIVALLQSSSSQIRTLEDLLHSRIKFGVHDTVFNRHYFKTETEPVRRAIYKTKVAPPGTEPRFISMEKGVKEMKKGLFAFHMETGVGYKFVGKYFEEGEKCGLKEIQYLRVIDPWLAVRKNTQFMEMFKIGTKRLQEHGLQQRENHLLYEKRPKCVGRQANFVSAYVGNNEIKMVSSVINSYSRPPSVLANVCWKPTKKMELINEINYVGPQNPIQFVTNLGSIRVNTIQNIIIVTDLNCPNSSHFMEQANGTERFRSPYRWLIIGEYDKTKEDTLNDLKHFHILIDSHVILSERNGDIFTLYLPYKQLSNSSEWKLESFGTWSAKQGLNKTNDMSVEITMRRKNLGGLPIAASLVITSNETKKQLFNLRDLHIDFITKASFRQLDPLYYFLNASRVLIFTDNWGYIINGSYNGMIGDIVREVAELTGTVVFITKQRLKVLDYLSYPTSTTVKFVFRQPSLSYENNLFILPFKPRVWFCIFGLIILMLLIVFINARWESIKYEPDTLDKTFLKPNLSEIALMVIGAITQQGSYTELKGTLGRVVMFLMFLAFLFLYTSYSANIVALLQSSSNQINTLADLLNSKLELGVEETPYNRHHFLAATDPIKKAIYEKKIVPRGYKPNFMSLEEGVRRLQKKPFAFNMFLGGGYKLVEKYFLEHEKCDLQEIEYIEENKPWLACRKKSPLKEMYKIGLFRNQEHGLNSRVNFLIYAKKPTCIVHGGTFDSVNMTDFYPALLMLAYGTILALILLLLEIFHWRQFRMINT